jgi:radical SAM superfamily enzyme YgiQ (UPF0313 family)
VIALRCLLVSRGRNDPNIRQTPIPRYDLLDIDAYHAIGVQWGRGCPFSCEFCDIVELFGRRPRTKEPEQFCRELEAILATGFHGSVFVVDDNFVGNRKETLRVCSDTLNARGCAPTSVSPFQFFTEASVDLARLQRSHGRHG